MIHINSQSNEASMSSEVIPYTNSKDHNGAIRHINEIPLSPCQVPELLAKIKDPAIIRRHCRSTLLKSQGGRHIIVYLARAWFR